MIWLAVVAAAVTAYVYSPSSSSPSVSSSSSSSSVSCSKVRIWQHPGAKLGEWDRALVMVYGSGVNRGKSFIAAFDENLDFPGEWRPHSVHNEGVREMIRYVGMRELSPSQVKRYARHYGIKCV